MKKTDEHLVTDALTHIAVLRRHLGRGDLSDETIADAVSLRLAAAIEALSELNIRVRHELFGDEWNVIWATRNRIAHGYASVDLEIIQNTVAYDVPELETRLRTHLDKW